MPIYEFYCSDCHTIFSFLARRPRSKRPDCPQCGKRRLERKASSFAVSSGRTTGDEGESAPADGDEAGLERAMSEMAREIEGVDEGDPRQMAGLMRRLFERTGMPVGPGMEEAMRRLESGEDPDRIEQEMGDLLESEMDGEPAPPEARRALRRLRPPRVDTTLYEL